MGEAALISHLKGKKHETVAAVGSSAIPIGEFMNDAVRISSNTTTVSTATKQTTLDVSAKDEVLKAEILWALKIMNSHYSFKSSEDMSRLFTAMFLDSQIAAKFTCDWRHFRNKICKELSTSKGAYTAQWNGSVSGKTYRVETDLEVYDPEAYIFFRQCMDNTVIHQARKGTPDEDKLYPLTPKEWETWFTTGFLVQWCEWERTLEVFSRVDSLFRCVTETTAPGQMTDRRTEMITPGKRAGKKKFNIPHAEEEPTDTRQQPSSPDDCLGILDDKEYDYIKCGTPGEPTIHKIIEVTIGYYLHSLLKERAKGICIYCMYLDELYRGKCPSCIDSLPPHYLEGHLEEIKQEIFKENYTVVQACVLFCLGNTPPSQQDIQDIAEDVLKEWTTSPFLTTRLKQVSSGNERLHSAVQKSLKIWSRNNGKCV
ncbi:hypothetical protein ABVT39_024512 [Epinephelus coioides]